MRVYRDSYKKGGDRCEASKYTVEIRDHHGHPRRIAAFTDKRASEEFGRKAERLGHLRAAGEQPTRELQQWIEQLPARLRRRLAKIGVLDPRRVAAALPLKDHVADFKQALLDKGNTTRHAHNTHTCITAMIEGTNAVFLSDVDAAAVSRYLARRREDGLSLSGSNHYLAAAKSFFNWLVKEGRSVQNPISHLEKVNADTDLKRVRRRLEADEFRQFLHAARKGPERFGMAGAERELLYRLAAQTGLRAAELRSLTRASFNLDGDEPTVTVAAAYAKNRRSDVLPLRPATAAEVKAHLQNKHPSASAFNVPPSDKTAKMVRADLADARAAWIKAAKTDKERLQREQSHFLAYQDAAGRRFDFHALRHQFASDLAAADVHPKTAQDLMRHSTISLTLDHYTHTARGKLASAVARLPDLSLSDEEQAQATGTDDVAVAAAPEDPASYSAPAGTGQGATVRDGALRMPVSGTDALDGALCRTGTYDDVPCTDVTGPGWIRTSDQSIMSRLL